MRRFVVAAAVAAVLLGWVATGAGADEHEEWREWERCPFPPTSDVDSIPVSDPIPAGWASYDANGDGQITPGDLDLLKDRPPVGHVPDRWDVWDANGNGVFENVEYDRETFFDDDANVEAYDYWAPLKQDCQDDWLRDHWAPAHLEGGADCIRGGIGTPGCTLRLFGVPSQGLAGDIGDAGSAVVNAPGDVVGGAANRAWEATVESIAKGADDLITATITSWMEVPASATFDEELATALQRGLIPWTGLIAFIALVFAAVKMMISHRAEHMQEAMIGLARTAVIGGGGIALLMMALDVSDTAADAILQDALGGDSGAGRIAVLASAAGPIGHGLIFILAIMAILTALIQLALLLVRGAALLFLAGTWQLASAASLAGNKTMWGKITAWIVAFVAFKPAAAIVYWGGFKLLGKGTGAQGGEIELIPLIQGMIVLSLAVFTLPALIRLVAPIADMGGPTAAGFAAGAATVAAAGAVGAPVIRGVISSAGGGPTGAVSSIGDGPPPPSPPPPGADSTPGDNGGTPAAPASPGASPGDGDTGAPGSTGEDGAVAAGAAPNGASTGAAASQGASQALDATVQGMEGPSGASEADSSSDGPSGLDRQGGSDSQ